MHGASSDVSSEDLLVRRFHGPQPYERLWQRMQVFTNERNDQTPDEVWLLQHQAVFTQGQAGKAEHVLAPGDIPVVPVDRGGQVTYHGPGQLVVYPLLNIARAGLGPRALVTLMEETMVATLADLNIDAYPRADAPGVYVEGQKIGSIGLRIRRGCCFHGLSLNVDMDLEPFRRINPCGYSDMQITQIRDRVKASPDLETVAELWLSHFQAKQQYRRLHAS